MCPLQTLRSHLRRLASTEVFRASVKVYIPGAHFLNKAVTIPAKCACLWACLCLLLKDGMTQREDEVQISKEGFFGGSCSQQAAVSQLASLDLWRSDLEGGLISLRRKTCGTAGGGMAAFLGVTPTMDQKKEGGWDPNGRPWSLCVGRRYRFPVDGGLLFK